MSITIIFVFGLIVFLLFLLGVFFNNQEVKTSQRSKIETDTFFGDTRLRHVRRFMPLRREGRSAD